jgi:(heptosyl)LPS beta-1,4-glucosyltransferase
MPNSLPVLISALVLTKNEAENLPGCLDSLAWADERLVVDSFSTDETVALARQAGARVVQHPFANFAAQCNYAQSQAQYDWILLVHADERVSPALRDEIQALAASGGLDQCRAYHIHRVHLISGRWFTHPPDRRLTPALAQQLRRLEVPRLYDRRQAVWERALHEQLHTPEPRGVLEGVICHYGGSNLSFALEPFNHYTDLEAAHLHRNQSRRVSLLGALWRGMRTFAYHYFLQGWLRHGESGLMMALHKGMLNFVNYAKLWERRRIEAGLGTWTDQDRQLLDRFDVHDRA